MSQFWEGYGVKGTVVSVTSAVYFFSLLMSTISGLLKTTISLVMIDLSQYAIKLAASSTDSGLYL